ncbi:MAG: pilus assembly protein [Collinsella sp.]
MLPTFLTLILLALQPVCLLYTRAVMESAAAETARLMTTTTAEDDDLKEFTRRRLAAVPNVSIFHAGGPLSWDIELGRAGAGGVSAVSVSGKVKPLPVIGAFARLWVVPPRAATLSSRSMSRINRVPNGWRRL